MCKGFYVDTVGRNKKVIENYIRNQLQEDIVADQISMEEYLDPLQEKKLKDEKNSTPGAGKIVQFDLSAPLGLASKEGL